MSEVEKKKQQTTAGFKVDVDFRDALDQQIAASGLQKNEWLVSAAEAMRGKSIKDTNQEYSKEIDEVDYHTRRISALFSNMIVQSVHIKESAVEELQGELKQYKELLLDTRNQLKSCQDNLSDAVNQVTQVNSEKEELIKAHEELKTSFNNVQDLIGELKDKNTKYEADIAILEPMAKENVQLNTRLDDTLDALKGLDDKMASLENEAAKQKQEFAMKEKTLLETYNEKLTEQENHYNDGMKGLEKYHEKEMQQLNEQHSIEQGKALLERDKMHQEALKKVQDDMNDKIQSLYDKMDKKEEKYARDIEKMQEKLEIAQQVQKESDK